MEMAKSEKKEQEKASSKDEGETQNKEIFYLIYFNKFFFRNFINV